MSTYINIISDAMERRYEFLRHKYYELLIPTLFMVMSEKICSIIDTFIIGNLVGGEFLAPLNLVSPMLYFTGVFYILFGQGGSLLALRAQSDLDKENSNFYFTLSIIGIIIVSLIYILMIFIFTDNILQMLHTPAEIFNITKEYLLTIMLFYPLNCYILVISYFIRSDGHPKLPFYAVLVANIFNILFDIIYIKGFNMGITGAALGSVTGYLISSIFISKYLLDKNRTFKFISASKLKIKKVIISLKEIVFNTPEVIGKIFFATQMSVFTYLCTTYYGAAGLLAFLVYDNSETFVYMFLSGIMKTMSPIVAVFHKEMDYKAVHYIVSMSMKQLLIATVPISILFFIYPEFLIKLFNITNPNYVKVIIFAIRITSFGLIGRCLSYLLANYTQAIRQNKIASAITILEEFLISIIGALILTNMIGGMGIWIAILLSETIPVLFYIVVAVYFQVSNKNEIHGLFMLQDSNLITKTFTKENRKHSEQFLTELRKIFKDNTTLVSLSISDLCENILENDVDEIDITIRLLQDNTIIQFIDDGKLYNPFNNKEFTNSPNIKKIQEIGCEFDYTNVLGYNKSYFTFNDISKNM